MGSDCLIHNTPFGETLFFHTKFIKLTYSCETQKTGRRAGRNACVYITQNKLSKWSINNGAVNMCARPLPTNHSLCQGSGANTNPYIHLRGESGNSGFEEPSVRVSLPSCSSTLLLFFCFLPSFLLESLQMCSYAKEN